MGCSSSSDRQKAINLPREFEIYSHYFKRGTEKELLEALDSMATKLSQSDDREFRSHLNSLKRLSSSLSTDHRTNFFILLLISKAYDKKKELERILLNPKIADQFLRLKLQLSDRSVTHYSASEVYHYLQRTANLNLEFIQKLADSPTNTFANSPYKLFKRNNPALFDRKTTYSQISYEERAKLESTTLALIEEAKRMRTIAIDEPIQSVLSTGEYLPRGEMFTEYLASVRRLAHSPLFSRDADIISLYCLSDIKTIVMAEQMFAQRFEKLYQDAQSSSEAAIPFLAKLQAEVKALCPEDITIFAPISHYLATVEVPPTPDVNIYSQLPGPNTHQSPYPVLPPSPDVPINSYQSPPRPDEPLPGYLGDYDQNFHSGNLHNQIPDVNINSIAFPATLTPNPYDPYPQGVNPGGFNGDINDLGMVDANSFDSDEHMRHSTNIHDNYNKGRSSKNFGNSGPQGNQNSNEKQPNSGENRPRGSGPQPDNLEVSRMMKENEEIEKLITSMELEKQMREEIVSNLSRRSGSANSSMRSLRSSRSSFLNLSSSTTELQRILSEKSVLVDQMEEKCLKLKEDLTKKERKSLNLPDYSQIDILDDRYSSFKFAGGRKADERWAKSSRAFKKKKLPFNDTSRFLNELYADIDRTLHKDLYYYDE